MSSILTTHEATPSFDGDVWGYWELLKPRVMSLVIFTTLCAMILSGGDLDPFRAFVALVCTAVGAGASGCLNMWYDRDIDALMERTKKRPIPRGVIKPSTALVFGLILSGSSVLLMGLIINWLAAFFLAFTIFFYAVVYTIWLKRWTPQNIVLGGAAGALPPVIGWTAMTNTLSWEPLVLFFIIFLWTPPHFWALSLHKNEDYILAKIPMLNVVSGPHITIRYILIYTVLMVSVSLVPWLIGMGSAVYGFTALLLGGIFLFLALGLFNMRNTRKAFRLFLYSIFYLFFLFLILTLDGYFIMR